MEYMLRHIDTYDYRRISINTYSVVHYIPFIQYTQMRANICTYQVSVQYTPISIHATQTKNNTYQYMPVRCCRGASATPSCDSALGGATPRRDSARDHSVQAVTPCPCPWLSGHATADTQQQQQWNCKSLANRISGLSVTRKLSVNSEFGILFGWIGITPISDTVTHIYRTVTVVHVLRLATRLAAVTAAPADRGHGPSRRARYRSLMSRALWLAWLSAALRCRASQASWIASDWSQSLWGILEEADLTRVCQVEPSSASDPLVCVAPGRSGSYLEGENLWDRSNYGEESYGLLPSLLRTKVRILTDFYRPSLCKPNSSYICVQVNIA